MPISAGMAASSCVNASSPPAEAPPPTIGNLAAVEDNVSLVCLDWLDSELLIRDTLLGHSSRCALLPSAAYLGKPAEAPGIGFYRRGIVGAIVAALLDHVTIPFRHAARRH